MDRKQTPKMKFYLATAVGLLVVMTLVLFGFSVLMNGETVQSLGISVIALAVALLLFVYLRRMYSDMKKGLPHEDERSQRIKERAGYLTAMLTIYFCLILAFVIDEAADNGVVLLITRHALEAVTIFEAVVFLLIWAILGRRG